MRVVVVRDLCLRELVAEVGEGIEDLRDGDPLAFPCERAGRRLVHGLCHSLPSASSSLAAAGGPHVPAAYICSGGRPSLQAASTGSIRVHAVSTSSARVNRVGSPIMQSSRSRSYASGASTRNEDAYRKSIATLRRRMPAAGTFAPNLSEMPSSGCMRSVMALGSSS